MMNPVFRPTLANEIIERYTGAQPALPDPAEHVLRQEENADSAASYGTYLENIRSLTQCITENMIVNLRFDFSFVNRLLGGALHAPATAGAAGRGMPVPSAVPSALGSAPRIVAAAQQAKTLPAVLTPQSTPPPDAAKTGAAVLTEPARGAAKGERPAAAERHSAEEESGAEYRAPAERAKTKSKKTQRAPGRPGGKAASAVRTEPAAVKTELVYAAPGGMPAQPGGDAASAAQSMPAKAPAAASATQSIPAKAPGRASAAQPVPAKAPGGVSAAQPVPAKAPGGVSAAPDAIHAAEAAHRNGKVQPADLPAASASAPAPAEGIQTARAAAASSVPAPQQRQAGAPNGRADKQAVLPAGVQSGRFGPAADAAEDLRVFSSLAGAPDSAWNSGAGNIPVKTRTVPVPAELLLPRTAAQESIAQGAAREGRADGEEKKSAAANMRPVQAEARVPHGGKDAAPQTAAAQQPAGRRQGAAAPGQSTAQNIPAPPWKPSPAVLAKGAAPALAADMAAHGSGASQTPRAGAERVLADAAAFRAQQTIVPRAARHFAGAQQPAAEGNAAQAARPATAENDSFPKKQAGKPAPWEAAENRAGMVPAAQAYPIAETVHAAPAADTQPIKGVSARQGDETVQDAKKQGLARSAAAKKEAAARAPDFAPAEQTMRRPAGTRAAGQAAGEAQAGPAEAHSPRLPQAAQTGKAPKTATKAAAAQEMPEAVRRQEAFLARLTSQPAARYARTAPAQLVPAAQDALPHPAPMESAVPLTSAHAAGAARAFVPAAPQAGRTEAAVRAADAADVFAPERGRMAAQEAPAAHFSGAELLYRGEAAQDAAAPAAAHAPENDIETIRTVRRETQRTVNAAVHREVHAAPPQTMENADPAAVTELAEKVYRKIEQRLKNEKWRRGL